VQPAVAKAEEVRQNVWAVQKEYLIEPGDESVKLVNTAAAGAVSGTSGEPLLAGSS
jgi:uncharacterized membrane protein